MEDQPFVFQTLAAEVQQQHIPEVGSFQVMDDLCLFRSGAPSLHLRPSATSAD
jgi:hypothetical protein